MRVPTIDELQELWVYRRVNQYYDENRPAPDHSLFIAEFAELMDAVRHDGWVDCLELLENNSEIDLDDVEHYKEVSPYRKQEEA